MPINFKIIYTIKKLFFTAPLLLFIQLSFAQQDDIQSRAVNFICASCEGGGGSGGGGLPPISCTGQRDTVFVDDVAGNNFSGTGRSWATAVKTLQRGLAIASTCEEVKYIFVAEGTYTASTTSGTAAARDYSFAVGRSISIFGGYPTGGGVRNFIIRPTILDGEIQDLYEAYHVMVIYGTTGTVSIDGFQFKNGFADGAGTVELGTVTMARNAGASLYIRDAANVHIRNCVFYTNIASNVGGAIYGNNSNLLFENCVFVNNTSGSNGGAIYVSNTSTVNITNCTLYNNLNLTDGDAVYNTTGTTLTMKNTLLWGNTVAFGGGGIRDVTYSLLPNGNMNNNNLKVDPFFKDVSNLVGTDGDWFTQDDGLTLLNCSPALNRGSNDITNALQKDITLTDRPLNHQVDIGAYETQGAPEITSISQHSINGDSTDTYFYKGLTALVAANNCRIMASLYPLGENGSVGRIKAKTYIDAGNLSYEDLPLVRRHFDMDDTQAAPNGRNTIILYFSNADFINYNARADTRLKLPLTSSLIPTELVRILQFPATSATGMPDSYGVEPTIIKPASVEWLSSASTWKISFHSYMGLGGIFLTASDTYEFTGDGNWSTTTNWLNTTPPPLNLTKHYKILVRENTQSTINTRLKILAGAQLNVAYGAVLTSNNLLEVEGDMVIERHKKIFTESGSFTVPAGITSIELALWGAGGYGGSGEGRGGHAGFVAGKLSVTPGEELTLEVAGTTGSNANAAYSAIKRGSTILVLAAGGGSGSSNGGRGGHGGAAGGDGTVGTTGSGDAGKGATPAAGGAGGIAGSGGAAGTSGNSLTGGNCSNNQGDGGKGYYGGGGSGTYDFLFLKYASGGGGGGSNYPGGLATLRYNGYINTPGIANALYNGGGVGGLGTDVGTAGKIIITW